MQNFKLLNVEIADLHNFVSKRTWGDWKFDQYDKEKKVLYITLEPPPGSGIDKSYNKKMKNQILEWMKKRNYNYRHLPVKIIYGGPY